MKHQQSTRFSVHATNSWSGNGFDHCHYVFVTVSWSVLKKPDFPKFSEISIFS